MQCIYIIGFLYLINSTLGDEPKIIIIGAGPAGIAAASKLYENGFQNVTILEAENRIGGRVHTTWFDNSWIDLGGQHVTGQTNNIAYELASPLGLLEVPQENESFEFTVYNSKGSQIPRSISNNLLEVYFDLEGNTQDFIGKNGSLGEYLTRMVTIEVNKRYPTVNETLLNQFMKLFERLSMASDATDNWDETSLRGYVEVWDPPGSLIINWKDRGFSTILDILMKKYPNPENELPVLNNTLLNSEIVNINYIYSMEGKALVETTDGRKYEADHVIMTPSLGVLKEQYETLFTPQLPESKIKTINGLEIGTVAKIYLSFEAPWWPNDSNQLLFIWDESDKAEYENDPDKKWLVDVFGFVAVPHRPRLLCGWVSGASARHMETLSEEEVLEQSFGLVNKFLGKSYNVTSPTGIKRTQWYSNKHFRGTYSSRSMKSEQADVWADQLAEPLLVNGKPILMFAGEATHAHYYGTVNGAIETGIREANRLVNMYKNATK